MAQDFGRRAIAHRQGGGDWTVKNLACLDRLLGGLNFDNLSHVFMDVSGITTLDTAGAHIIHRTMNKLDRGGIAAVLSGLDVAYRPLLEIVTEANGQPHEPLREQSHFILEMFERVGRALIDALIEAKSLVNFFGLTIIAFGSAIAKPRSFRPIALINQIEQTGFNAVLIVCLLNFLIGIVIAYQGAVQLRQFGAEIFMIDGLAFGIPREIAVLITAIVVAGRSGSAFTAQIGTMQVNQEVDALKAVSYTHLTLPTILRV